MSVGQLSPRQPSSGAVAEGRADPADSVMISLEEAVRLALAMVSPLAPARVALSAASGRVLAETVRAAEAVPRFANSAMDGYALRAADAASAPVRLRVTGASAAGDAAGALSPGEAMRIMTGAPLPAGADAICMLEHTQTEDGGRAVLIMEPVSPGSNVRAAGEDIAPGTTVFAPGTQLGPAHVGVLASLGVRMLSVYPRPAVGVLSTGDELSAPGDDLLPGKIRDANRPALLAQLRRDGFRGLDLGISPDDQDVLSSRIEEGASRCDALIATGGVSVGDHDMLKVALEKLGGGTMRHLHVAVKPGKHMAIASLGPQHVPVFALPGNPVAALVAYELLVRPALRSMAGCTAPIRPRTAAIAETDLRSRPGPKLHVLRVIARPGPDGVLRVRSSGGQDSHMLRALALANALALLPGGNGVRAGERVEILLLDADLP